jgi:two-component sensor histidine kinase
VSAVAPVRTGSFGAVRAEVATPLAVVLSELVQNAVEHGLDRGPGLLEVRALRADGVLRVEVVDDGAGLPAGFDLTTSDRLGLQIVRTLVEGELGGTLRLDLREGGGTVAAVEVPLAA